MNNSQLCRGQYIGGQWRVPAGSDTFAVINPATEEVIVNVPAGNRDDIEAAVSAARQAFDHGPWPRFSTTVRKEPIGVAGAIIPWCLAWLIMAVSPGR